MPCATIHMMLADEALSGWQAHPERAPFPLDAPCIRGFLHGAMAPDQGFIPGLDRLVSELAHYHRPADLSRALLRGAASEPDIAFAWGWIVHVLGDVAIHPLIGQACGEILKGSRSIRMNAAEDVETHVSVEVGLDILVLTREPQISRPVPTPYFDEHSIGLLADAYRNTYGIRLDRARLLRDHRTAVIRTARWPTALQLLSRGRGLPSSEGRAKRSFVLARMLGLAARLSRRATPVRGFLTPRQPPAWVLEEVDAVRSGFFAELDEQVKAGAATLENRNLESGESQEGGDPHPASRALARRVNEWVTGKLGAKSGPERVDTPLGASRSLGPRR